MPCTNLLTKLHILRIWVYHCCFTLYATWQWQKKTEVEKLLSKHDKLTHSEALSVVSHVQRKEDDWYINTIMVVGQDVPFKFRRRKVYKNLTGSRVNLTYYPINEEVAGMEFEVMKVVRIKIS